METLEIDCSPLSSDLNGVSRKSFVDLRQFHNITYFKTKFHRKFMARLQNYRRSPMKDVEVSGISGIGKSTTLIYFMLDCFNKKDESVHYIDLEKDGFKIENFFEYAKGIKSDDNFLIIDHVTLFNKHLIAEIWKRINISKLIVQTGFTAGCSGQNNLLFGKDNLLDEEEFNQMWIAQECFDNSDLDLRERGREVFGQGVLNGLHTPRLLHTFCHLMAFDRLSLREAVHRYKSKEQWKIDNFLKAEADEEYENFLLHSRILLHNLSENDDTILTSKQYAYMRIAINIFDVQASIVTKEDLEQDGRFIEHGLEENDLYYRVTYLVPSFADYWKQRLPYHIEQVLKSTHCKDLLDAMFQSGGGRKEVGKLVVEAQTKSCLAFIPFNVSMNTHTTYEESENDCLIEQMLPQWNPISSDLYTVKLCSLQKFNTTFSGHAKNVARCAMWIKEKIEENPKDDFILHPDISNFMGIDYFLRTRDFKVDVFSKGKYKNYLFLVQVATGSSHNGKTVGEALDIVKEVLAETDLTIHLVIAIISQSQIIPYCLKKCSFQNASAVNLTSARLLSVFKQSSNTLYDYIMKLKSLNKNVL